MNRVPPPLLLIIVVTVALVATPRSASADQLSLIIEPEAGPSGTVVTLSVTDATPQHTLRFFSEPWTRDGECGTITQPQLLAEIDADSSGEVDFSYRAVRTTDDVLGITFYVWDPVDQVRSNLVCFEFTAPPDARYFPETRHWVSHGFLAYWEQFGGLPLFGYPLTEEFEEDGVTVQYFERARFEWRPGVWPERHDVLVGRLGAELHPSRQPDYPTGPYPFSYEPPSDNPACRFFPMPVTAEGPDSVGFNVCHGFRSSWEEFGGLAAFGYPLSKEYRDAETDVVVQYFERARFEWHPGASPERHDVLLGRLGAEALRWAETTVEVHE